MNLGFTYGDRFFNDRLGMLLSASYQNAPSGSYDTEFMWEQNEDGKVYVSDYQMRQYLSPVNVKVIRRLLILISMKTIN